MVAKGFCRKDVVLHLFEVVWCLSYLGNELVLKSGNDSVNYYCYAVVDVLTSHVAPSVDPDTAR